MVNSAKTIKAKSNFELHISAVHVDNIIIVNIGKANPDIFLLEISLPVWSYNFLRLIFMGQILFSIAKLANQMPTIRYTIVGLGIRPEITNTIAVINHSVKTFFLVLVKKALSVDLYIQFYFKNTFNFPIFYHILIDTVKYLAFGVILNSNGNLICNTQGVSKC